MVTLNDGRAEYYRRGMQSPWGAVDHVTKIDEGIYRVSTPGHGGLMVRRDVAEKRLTPAAIAAGERFGERPYVGNGQFGESMWIAYEEDEAVTVPIFELEELWPEFFKSSIAMLSYGPDVCAECEAINRAVSFYRDMGEVIGTVGTMGYCKQHERDVRRNHRMATDTRGDLYESLSFWHVDYLRARGMEPLPEGLAFHNRQLEEERLRREKSPDYVVAAFGDWHTKQPGVIEVVTADKKWHFVTEESYDKKHGHRLSNMVVLDLPPCEQPGYHPVTKSVTG